MHNYSHNTVVPLFGGIVGMSVVAGVAIAIAYAVSPHVWLQLLIIGWAVLPTLVAFLAGGALANSAIAHYLGDGAPDGEFDELGEPHLHRTA